MIKQRGFVEAIPTDNKWIIQDFSGSELPLNALAEVSVPFYSAGQVFGKIQVLRTQQAVFIVNNIQYDGSSVYVGRLYGPSGAVAQNNWTDKAYRTLYFFSAPTGDLLTWLETYAEKQ